MSLEKKQEKKNKEGKFIGFKNGLAINEEIKDIDSWSKPEIEARTQKLVDDALGVFKL